MIDGLVAVMERTMSATEARVHFGEVLDAVFEGGDVVYVARGGIPVAVVLSVDAFHLLRSNADPWATATEAIREHQTYLQDARDAGGLRDFDVEAAIQAGREERDEQLVDPLR